MTSNNLADRDEVLFEFHRQCLRPTAEQIVEWTERYPQFADDIREHAAARLDWAARDELPTPEADEDLLARGRSRALNALHDARTARQAARNEAASFQELMQARGTNVAGLARELDIERAVIADLTGGRMLPPLGSRFADALANALDASTAIIQEALARACQTPRLGLAKATGQPRVVQRPYADIIRSSGMTPERKSYWLDEG
jgi:hypothetical protein